MNAGKTLTAALTVCLAGAAHADPLSLNDVPAARAAAALSARYGTEIRLQRYSARHVTLSFDEAEGRLQAINELANALGMDFTKTYVIRKAAGGDAVTGQVDSSANLPVTQRTLLAREAIAMVAGVDDAAASVAADVIGTVTLSGSPLTVSHAAEEIAQQTGTHWETVYVLSPRTEGPGVGGTVIGRTGGGAAIIQSAFVYYVDPVKEAEQKRAAEEAQRQAMQAQAKAQAAATTTPGAASATVASNGNTNGAVNGNAYSPNSYYNPYGYGGYGYNAYGFAAQRAYSPGGGVTVLNQGYTPAARPFSIAGY